MSELKEFARDQRGYVFMSDARDIAVSYEKRSDVYDWATKNSVVVEYKGTLGGTDVWRVKDDQHRAWFTLRWS